MRTGRADPGVADDDIDHDDECRLRWTATPTADSDDTPNRQMVPLSYCRHGVWRNIAHVPEVPADDAP
jgi:hypothetical protein